MSKTTNLEKHTTNNPISRLFLNNFLQTVVSTVKPLSVKSVLDVGCGEGFTLDRLRKENIGERLEGVDAVDEAITVGKKLYPTLILKKGDIYDLDYKDNAFDLLICTEVLEHLKNPDKALQELLRVSKKYVLVTVPNEPWFTFMRIARGKNLLHLGAHPEHINHWTSGGFTQFAGQEATIVVKRLPFPWTMLLLQK